MAVPRLWVPTQAVEKKKKNMVGAGSRPVFECFFGSLIGFLVVVDGVLMRLSLGTPVPLAFQQNQEALNKTITCV